LGVIGGNPSDIDLLATYDGFARDMLAYMLHHRGHTRANAGCIDKHLQVIASRTLVDCACKMGALTKVQ
jgi:hypothetical protein